MASQDTDTSSERNTPFIDSSTASEAYIQTNNWFRPYFEPIEEFERIARNKPSPKISNELPKITDGTMAAIVQELPKRIIQQLATGQIDCKEYPEYAEIADIVHRYKLLPMYNRMGTALQKHWNMTGKALTWGRSTSYTFYTSTNGIMHTDFVIPYVKDVLSEVGKVYAPDSNISFLRSWYQKRDIKAIIDREKWMMDNIKGYKTDWDLKLLADFMNTGSSTKPADQQTPAEKEKGGDVGGFEVIHAFQNGKKAEFYSFAPRYQDGKNLRTKVNNDPRGKMPLDFEYCNIDLSNPLGRGQVELSGGIQNIMDQKLQMNQFLTTLLMGPPLMAYGNVKKETLKFRPNAIWDMGSGQNNKVEPYTVNNVAIQSFINDMQFLQSKIYNLNSAQDNSIPADSGNVGQSKTQAGVKAAEGRLGISDNYVRKQHETWFNDQAETSINIYFSEMKGEERIKLEKDDFKRIYKSEDAKQFLDPATRELIVPYKKISDVSFKFSVDASSSEVKEDADNAQKLADALKLVQSSQNPDVLKTEVKLTKLLIDEIGAEGTDDLFPDEEVDENGQPVQQAQNDPQAMMQQLMPVIQQMIEEGIKASQKPQEDPTLQLIKALGLKYDQLPPEARQIVLEHTGFGGDTDDDPISQKHNMEMLTQLSNVDSGMESQSQARAGQQQQADQAQASNDLQKQQMEQQAQQAQMQAQQQGSEPSSGSPANVQPSSTPPAGNDTPPALNESNLDPQEQELVEELLRQGFSEDDVEQAVVMIRQGMPLEQVISTLGAKYAGQ